MTYLPNKSLSLPPWIEGKLPPPEKIKTVLVMCTGNICRSPMAEGILRKALVDRGMDDITVFSAGTATMDGLPASIESVELCADHGIDISGHRSRKIDAALAQRADLILVMEKRHLYHFATHQRQTLDKACLLGDFSPLSPGEEIADPIQLPIRYYKIAFERICLCANRFADWLATRGRTV